MEIFAPVLISPLSFGCQLANKRLGESQCLKLFFFKQNYVWVNSRGETGCKCSRSKITEGKSYML